MDYIADLHIHSPFSRATSPKSTLDVLAAWAMIKGIQVVGTGDFTHPAWFGSLIDQLEPAEPGLFSLKNEGEAIPPFSGVKRSNAPVRFMLSTEISCIYKRHGSVRKVHNLLYLPDFGAVERLNARLARIGNIQSDGRPILGLDSRDLLEILLEITPDGVLIPAHIWTPWFSLFGSRSGFDSIEECFGDLASHIFALETGLSSDPAMNRLISSLDHLALISNSDCHSPSNLGREANLFSTGMDYFSLWSAVKSNYREKFFGTIEFFPEEGKYHADGHRACEVCLDALQSRSLGAVCPVCSKSLTLGVQSRVCNLADREEPGFTPNAPRVYSLIPLPEVLGELLGTGASSKKVLAGYAKVIAHFGSEFALLLHASLDEISQFSPLLSEAVRRIREGQVIRHPGYDGQYGVIQVFAKGEPALLGLCLGALKKA